LDAGHDEAQVMRREVRYGPWVADDNVATLAISETLTARVHQESGDVWAEVVELPGCFASGRDEAELREALAEAIGMVLAKPPDDKLDQGHPAESRRAAGEPDDPLRDLSVFLDEFLQNITWASTGREAAEHIWDALGWRPGGWVTK